MNIISAVAIAFVLDILFGDPIKIPHIVVAIGKLISLLEKGIRKLLPKTNGAEIFGGALMAVLVCGVSFGFGFAVLWLCGLVHPLLRLAAESFFCWQCLAMKSLKDAGIYIYDALKTGDIEKSREAVGRIVGRDVSQLDEPAIRRAAVESVAESTVDGVISPLIYMIIGGAPLAMVYKAINTMDSMVGYKNDKYMYFGRVPAHIDDVANFIPARIGGVLMVLAAFICGFDGKNSWRIFRRDRLKHKSPNSAHAESAVAGALHVRLAGNSYYFGKLVEKPYQGDDDRPIADDDIKNTIKMMYCASAVMFVICIAARGAFLWL